MTNYLNDEAFFIHSADHSLTAPLSPESKLLCNFPDACLTNITETIPVPTLSVEDKIPRHKRQSHIKAEHKRRNNIQVNQIYFYSDLHPHKNYIVTTSDFSFDTE